MDKTLYQADGKWLGLNSAVKVDHREWLAGAGKVPAEVMFVGGYPGRMETSSRSAVSGELGRVLLQKLDSVGIDSRQMYYTFAVKYGLGQNKLTAKDVKACKPYLIEEIKRVKPKFIVCMGKDALDAVCGKEYKFSVIRGTPVPYPGYDEETVIEAYDTVDKRGKPKHVKAQTHINHVDVEATVFAVFNPAFLDIAPKETAAFDQELVRLQQVLTGHEQSLEPFKQNLVTINTVAELEQVKQAILEQATNEKRAIPLSLDCEWHGDAWYRDNSYLRTVQLGFENGAAVIIEFTSSRETALGYEAYHSMDNPEQAWLVLKSLLEGHNVRLIGHNIKEDGLWLMKRGIDIRANVIWDTMLSESLLNQAGPFGLEELALKYTEIPRWSIELEQWKREAGGVWHKGGYGFIPPQILNPYAGIDVVATMAIFQKQLPLMSEYLKPRGEYASLFEVVMQTQNNLYEIEITGLPVDTEMLDKMIAVFEPKVETLKRELIKAAVDVGCSEDWNPDSADDVTDLLFRKLNITPFKSTKATGGKLWEDAIRNLCIDDVDALDEIGAATDAMSLTILADQHPLVQQLLDYRRVGQIRKTWLRWPDENGEGGLYGNLGPDKRLHSSLSLLTQTGRLRSRSPNVQNFPKKAQKFLNDIFAEELKTDPWLIEQGSVPTVRQIVTPPPGYVLIEGDFIQAELFTMAALSNDDRMWKTLTTPGLDLHDKTAIDGFGIQVLEKDGHPLKEAELLERALGFWQKFGGGTRQFNKKAYEDSLDEIMSSLIYVEQSGHKMTRKEFKKTLRVSAKSVNFGIPYGRQAQSIGILIKSETGTKEPLSLIIQNVQQMLDTWKTVSYPKAWQYMETCSHSAMTDWIVTNPWGRSRRFAPTTNRKLLAGYGREGSNLPVQSTVADTCNIAIQLMREERSNRNLHFKFCNQVHDAIMTLVPISEIQQMKQLYHDTMGNIRIPIVGREPLVLGIDIEVMSRWSVEYKER